MAETSVDSFTRWTYRLAALFTFLAVAVGSAVCATESGAACPSWPGCYVGQITPTGTNSGIEFFHRVIAFLSLLLMGAAAWRGRRLADRPLRWMPLVSLVAAISSAVFGMMIVLFSLPLVLGLIDVTAALAAMCLTATAAVRVAAYRPGAPLVHGTRLSRLAWTAVATVIGMHLLGIIVATQGSFVRCLGWPVWRVVDSDSLPAVQMLRIAVGIAAAGLLLAVIALGWRRPSLRWHAALLGVLLASELVMGQLIVGQFTGAEPRQIFVAAGYSMLAGTILWCSALLAARAGDPRPEPGHDGPQELDELSEPSATMVTQH